MAEYGQGSSTSSYGKRPLWQWILIYIVIGAIIYGLIYYFIFAKKGSYSSNGGYTAPQQNSQTGY